MSATPMLADGLRMIAVLVLIVGGLVFVNIYVRRQVHAGRGRGGRRIRVLENAHLGVKKRIAMVQVPGAVLVLGITAERIALLERIDDPDGIHGASSPRADNLPGANFKTHLQRLTATFATPTPASRPDESA